jgi:tyrosyl-tRNA synthetase
VRAAAEAAAATARKTFEERELAESLPTVDVPGAEFDAGFCALSASCAPALSPRLAKRAARFAAGA